MATVWGRGKKKDLCCSWFEECGVEISNFCKPESRGTLESSTD